MSKLKLLLLGGIFTLFGILNFSNAESYTFTYNGGVGYTPETFTTDIPLNELQVDYQCDGNYCYFDIMANDGTYADLCFIIYDDGVLSTCNYDGVGTFLVGGLSRESEANNGNFASITLSDGQSSGGGEGGSGGEGGQIIPGGFNNFTPAIDGLHSTVKQLIPLVVYLGIGALVVILGFIAIRWLVNFMSNGIKSKFSSKRG